MNAAAIIKAAIPGACSGTIDYIVWSRTAYPFKMTPRSLYRAASGWRRANEKGHRLCEFCDNLCAPEEYECAACRACLAEARRIRPEFLTNVSKGKND